ncbi:MAG: hypothetical protein IKS33_00560 [Bacteroidales bacterium]|nr:hypothetical protein [Bacteroidales bacterium]
MYINFEKEIKKIFEQLTDEKDNSISKHSSFVPPFNKAGKDIRLVIIGQDPTIRNEEQRKHISVTLNLDKSGSLKKYVEEICSGLNISLSNVYATNVFKYFYTKPPAQTFEVLEKHLSPNLILLEKELSNYPNCPIIILGEPVLKLLVNKKSKVRDYWGYDEKTHKSTKIFKCVLPEENKLNRIIFPFCHQPSLRKDFYKENLNQYIKFVKEKYAHLQL